MKSLIFFLITLCLLTGCSNSIADNHTNTIVDTTLDFLSTDSVDYLIEDSEANIISIEIPHTNNMSPEETAFIQQLVRKRVQKMTGAELDLIPSNKTVESKDREYSQYCILMETQVTQNVDTHVSIVFNGYYNKKGSAHPINWLFSVNYDRKTLQEIPFSNKFIINTELYHIFSDFAEKAIKDECGGAWPDGWGPFSEVLCSQNKFLAGMKNENDFCYYLQETGVVISYWVPHAIGDHKEVTIPYDKLQEKT